MLNELHDDKSLSEVTLAVKLPRHLRDRFRYVIKNNPKEATTVNEVLARYIIKYIGEYNKERRRENKMY